MGTQEIFTNVTELTEVLDGKEFVKTLFEKEDIEVFYTNKTVFQFGEEEFRIPFYPIHRSLKPHKISALKEALLEDVSSDKFKNIIKLILSPFLSTIKAILEEEYIKSKEKYPNSKLKLFFGPADTINDAATIAQPIYAWWLHRVRPNSEYHYLMAETSFIFLPEDKNHNASFN